MRTGSSARRATTPEVLGVVAAARALVASPAWVQLQRVPGVGGAWWGTGQVVVLRQETRLNSVRNEFPDSDS